MTSVLSAHVNTAYNYTNFGLLELYVSMLSAVGIWVYESRCERDFFLVPNFFIDRPNHRARIGIPCSTGRRVVKTALPIPSIWVVSDKHASTQSLRAWSALRCHTDETFESRAPVRLPKEKSISAVWIPALFSIGNLATLRFHMGTTHDAT